MARFRRVVSSLAAVALALTGGALAQAAPTPTPQADRADAGYTVSVGSTGSYAHPTDTPASPYTDKDGTFYFQQSAALYGKDDPRYWDFFTGKDFDDAKRSSAISDAVNPANDKDRNNDTTWRCNNSPTGLKATAAPAGSGYSQKNYCDLSGVWVDPDSGDWYGLVHNEFTPQPFGDGIHYDAIDYAVSTDQGRTWTVKDHVITSPYSTKRGDTGQFPHETYSYGDGDQRLFVDAASGYFYVYYGSRIVAKGGNWEDSLAHVARAPIAKKMAPDSWEKWYDGAWSQPGVGGKESNMVPANEPGDTGYTPVEGDYDPANKGSVAQQIAAGELPPKSPLFVMNIAYDAYLGQYIGAPETVNGKAPQQYYVTDDLSTQKWRLAGDTGSYTSNSWYRWFLDGANKTNSTIVGKTFRSYCSIECAHGDGEYANITIDRAGAAGSGAKAVFDPAKTYRIGSGAGQTLARSWSFKPNGDGSYRIADAAGGKLLGVDSRSKAGRAWGAKTALTAAPSAGPTVGQQWFVIPTTDAKGRATGQYRLVNRYSGLALGLASDRGRVTAGTAPVRSSAEQTLTVTPTG
ncbi:RICIN domain-containing protein [Streptomyces sp. NPDC059009]|uniref:RICIN domain-containing protein n=1 Tax=Streptomyces sp. NPDC059009 TaxID=3346694 RepID=UPI0036AE39DF